MRALGDSWVMSDENHSPALLLLEANDQIQNRMSVLAVEITGGFISEEQRWLVSQTPRNRDSLSLAAGEFGWKMIESRAQDRPV